VERWGDFQGADAMRARVIGICLALQRIRDDLLEPLEWSEPDYVADIRAQIESARENIDKAIALLREHDAKAVYPVSHSLGVPEDTEGGSV
jgi:hypothetical protein